MQTINTTTLNDQAVSQEAMRNIAGMGHADPSASNNNTEKSAVEQDNEEALVNPADLLSSDRNGIDANNTIVRIATALVLCTVFAFGVLVLASFWGNLTGGNTVSQDELPETEESEEKVTTEENEEDNLSAKLALSEQKGDSLASKSKAQPRAQLVKDAETVEAEPEAATPRPVSQPATPRPAPQAREVEVDPLEEWARLSNLGTASGSKEAAIAHLNETNNLTASASNSSSSRIPSSSSTTSRTPVTRTTNPPLPKSTKTPPKEINTDELENALDQDEVAQIASVSIGANTLPQGSSSDDFENLSTDALNILNDNSSSEKYTSNLPSKPNAVGNTINHLSSLGNQSALDSPKSQTEDDLPEKISPTNQAIFNPITGRENPQIVALNLPNQKQAEPEISYSSDPVQDENNLSDQPKSNRYQSRNPRLPSVKTEASSTKEIAEKSEIPQSPVNQPQKITQIKIGGKHQIPFGTTTTGEVSTSVVWSEGIDANQTRATINLNEPLLSDDGSVAVKANSSLIVEVKQITNNGLTILEAIAISYENSQGKLVQEALPSGAILVKGEDSQALIAEKSSDSGGTLLGQDLLISSLAAGARGFEVLNEPESNSISFDQSFDSDDDDFDDDAFFRSASSSFDQTEDRDPSLLNGAGEGAFSAARERLEDRSERIEEEELARTPIYQVEAGTPVSIYVNSFLEINN